MARTTRLYRTRRVCHLSHECCSRFFRNGTRQHLFWNSSNFSSFNQFFTRWITHICAPTFIFLAGASIAISNFQQRQQGINEAVIERELLLRGAFITLIDLCLFSLVSGKPIFQVHEHVAITIQAANYYKQS